MRGSTREKIYENEHDAVNDFIERKQAMGGSQTVAPVDEEVNHAIKRYRLVRPDNDSEYLFLSIRGNRVQTTQVQRAVRDAAVRSGVMDEGETVHADAEVMVEPGTAGFVRAFVDELPSPFDCDTEVLADLPVHNEE